MVQRPTRLYEAYVFDMDGTIYLGDELLPGAARLITELRRREIPVRFLSNNPTRDPDMYAAKLTRLGLPTGVDDIANTVVTTVRWLMDHRPGAVVFPIAEEPLCRALAAAGIEISEDPSRIDIVISSYDRKFDYRKLQIAFDAIWFHRRAELIETNPDRYCPFPGGPAASRTARRSPPRSRPRRHPGRLPHDRRPAHDRRRHGGRCRHALVPGTDGRLDPRGVGGLARPSTPDVRGRPGG